MVNDFQNVDVQPSTLNCAQWEWSDCSKRRNTKWKDYKCPDGFSTWDGAKKTIKKKQGASWYNSFEAP